MSVLRKIAANKSGRGQASVELALSLPLLLMMFLVVVETGRAFYIAISVANAARAGVQYGSQNLTTAGDNSGMETAATNDAPNIAGITATANAFLCMRERHRVHLRSDRLRR